MNPPSLSIPILGTPLRVTDYAALIGELQERARRGERFAVEFANTHVAALRRHDGEFGRMTSCFDAFIPDGMPLIWIMNWRGAGLRDRVYGPTFMRRCVEASPGPFRHYFLGGTPECRQRLIENMTRLQPGLEVAGWFDGMMTEEAGPRIVEEINAAAPDFIWIALGTPKQQAWISRHQQEIARGIILSVGFAFDVNAGTKPDAPAWMQKRGLTWLFRLCSEPRRMAGRYLIYNSLFCFYLVRDFLFGSPLKSIERGPTSR